MSKNNWWAGLAVVFALMAWAMPTTVVRAAEVATAHAATPDDDEDDDDGDEDHEDHEDHEEEDPETAS